MYIITTFAEDIKHNALDGYVWGFCVFCNYKELISTRKVNPAHECKYGCWRNTEEVNIYCGYSRLIMLCA